MSKKKALKTHRSPATNVTIRRETFEGKEYLVAPVVAVREGVLNGELLPAEEIEASVNAWNGEPLPVYHPMERGMYISANRPDVLESANVGRFFNAHYEDGALKGELWVDIDKANELGGDALVVLERLESGESLEVSTGYFCDTEDGRGTFNDVRYNGIQRNLRPDHLALLPSEIGACSWADGCGAPRINSVRGGEKQTMWTKLKKLAGNIFSINEDVSHDDIAQLLETAMTERTGNASSFVIRERFDGYFIYQENVDGGWMNGKIYKQPYSIDEDRNVSFGDPVEVRYVESYETIESEVEDDELLVNKKQSKRKGEPKSMKVNNDKGFRINKRSIKRRIMKANELDQSKEELINEIIDVVEEVLPENIREVTEETIEAVVEEVTGDVADTIEESTGEEAEQIAEDFVEQVVREMVEDIMDDQSEEEKEEEEDDMPATNKKKTKVNKKCGCGSPETNHQQQPKINIDQWIEQIPDPEMQQFMKSNRQKQKEHRTGLIQSLSANNRCAFSKSELQTMETNQLEKLAKSMAVEDYSGLGMPHVNTNYFSDDSDVPAPPAVVRAINKREGK